MEKLRIIVGGYIGLYPTGGATLDYIQYPLGLKLMGHDVYYIEDTRQYPIFQEEGAAWDNASACISYLKDTMELFGFRNHWAYRDIASGQDYGMSTEKIREVCRTADIFINISCSTYVREEYLNIPIRILIDSDPMFTQMQYAIELKGTPESKDWNTKRMLESHNYLFTFGESIHAKNCLIPEHDFNWLTTRQPVCLSLWKGATTNQEGAFTSIMNWSGREKLSFNNSEWGQKDVEFMKFKEMPTRCSNVKFKVVVNPPLNKDSDFNQEELENLGWEILNPQQTVASKEAYQQFIHHSFGEFSVAKETYVKSNSGWFSCRSACYLAAGKPVVTQDTGWSKHLPTGKGLFAFTDLDSAQDALQQVRANYKHHTQAARKVAEEYFDSNKVLIEMLSQIN